MRVCFVSHSGAEGGAASALLETVAALSERGIECRVVVPARGWLVRELAARGVSVSIVRFTWWMGLSSPLWKRAIKVAINAVGSVRLAIAVRRWRCDVVYSNGLTICAGAWGARIAALPHVWHVHEFGYEHHGLTFELGETRSLRQVGRLSSACITSSQALASRFKSYIDPVKLRVVYQSVRGPEQHRPTPARPDGPFRCAIVGALQKGKAQDEAIRAIAELQCRGVAAELDVVGAGDPGYERNLRALALESGVAHAVHFTGFALDPFAHMHNADAVIVCSRFEGFGRVTVEAMLCARPVVAARSGATPELIHDGVTGFLYEPGDVSQLAGLLAHLAANPAERRRLGEGACEWAESRFSADRYGREMAGLLTSVTVEYAHA